MSLPQRHKHRQSRTSIVVSVLFHIALVGVVGWLAARKGMLGKVAQDMVAVQVEDKKPEPEKPKEQPKPEVAKVEDPKPTVTPTATPAPVNDPTPSPANVPPAVDAPAAVDAPEMFIQAAPTGPVITDKIERYRAVIQGAYLAVWDKPPGPDDANYAADVEVTVDSRGRILDPKFVKGSGDSKWDATVKEALAKVKEVGEAPPDKFPQRFTVRFDAVTDSVPVQ